MSRNIIMQMVMVMEIHVTVHMCFLTVIMYMEVAVDMGMFMAVSNVSMTVHVTVNMFMAVIVLKLYSILCHKDGAYSHYD